MNRPCRRAILAPLLAVVAMLLGLTGTASAAFNPAATEAPLGNFLLWEYEASLSIPLEYADPSKDFGVWTYDDALGVPVYVRQNPWTFFDPLGLQIDDTTHRVTRRDDSGWDNPKPKRDRENQTKEKHEEKVATWKSARETHQWNVDNGEQIKAWENYDLPIKLLGQTTEGAALLSQLRGDQDNVYTIFFGNKFSLAGGEAVIGGGVGGRAAYLGKLDGKNQYVSMVQASIMAGVSRNSDGSPNVDSMAVGHMWEELFHHDDGWLDGPESLARQKSVYGTYSPKDTVKHPNGHVGNHPLTHERRATSDERRDFRILSEID